ncbi:hypothetical protein KRP22_011920 [Phytophthora ramorum]|uniref:uncharacterized protein n=1 Tax=Phytophthora ramorum TaxID=164328 RepID=UPI00309A5CE1|nr:hypothetical protein KRP23_11004 [Phytophthora ramorum]KAH7498617.1 hypothetical protein KRP22_11758 [Phytophthora ramorum]
MAREERARGHLRHELLRVRLRMFGGGAEYQATWRTRTCRRHRGACFVCAKEQIKTLAACVKDYLGDEVVVQIDTKTDGEGVSLTGANNLSLAMLDQSRLTHYFLVTLISYTSDTPKAAYSKKIITTNRDHATRASCTRRHRKAENQRHSSRAPDAADGILLTEAVHTQKHNYE